MNIYTSNNVPDSVESDNVIFPIMLKDYEKKLSKMIDYLKAKPPIPRFTSGRTRQKCQRKIRALDKKKVEEQECFSKIKMRSTKNERILTDASAIQ